MRKLFGWILTIIGLPATAFMFFMTFEGKYGWRQFTSALAEMDYNENVLPFLFVALAVLVLGIWLIVGKKKAERGE